MDTYEMIESLAKECKVTKNKERWLEERVKSKDKIISYGREENERLGERIVQQDRQIDVAHNIRDSIYSMLGEEVPELTPMKALAEKLDKLLTEKDAEIERLKLEYKRREIDVRLYKWGHSWELKYDRLVACIKKHGDSNWSAKGLLEAHSDNEAKYAKKQKAVK